MDSFEATEDQDCTEMKNNDDKDACMNNRVEVDKIG